ncbi:MAG TPA: hypothetical protein VIL16_20000 [Trebonia sp.]
MLEQLGLVRRGQLAVRADRRRPLDLRLRIGDLQLAGQHDRPVERHEGQPMAADHPDPDRAEGGLVGAGVDVDRLKLPDLLAVRVDDVVLPPVPDVLSLEHAVDLPFPSPSKRLGKA